MKLNFLNHKNSLDAILSDFTHLVSRCDALIEDQSAVIDQQREVMTTAQNKVAGAQEQIQRALRISTNIKKLID